MQDDVAVPLTVIIPVYNEATTIRQVLSAVANAAYDKQIVIVDDGSKDDTAKIARQWLQSYTGPALLEIHAVNRGKGAAIRTGLSQAIGEVVLIQDGDLECDPIDYPLLVEPVLRGEVDAVYGSRYSNPNNHVPWNSNRLCVHFLNFLVRVLYFHKTTDEATCYKAVRRIMLQQMNLQCNRFEFCPEVTAKLCRLGASISEVPISYTPRTVAAGKKIRWWDGLEAIWTLVRWRFAPLNLVSEQTIKAQNVRKAA